MRIGIIGLGVVGSAVAHGLQRIGHQVFGYDIKDPATSFQGILDTALVFICVPTPGGADGSCDISKVANTVLHLSESGYAGVVVIKSTVVPGTTERLARQFPSLRLAFCPEFLRERAAVTDFVDHHDLCVIGTHDEADFEIIKAAHGRLPQHICRLSPTEAELAKYFSNTFNALRIVFANEFFEVARALGADYQAIKSALVRRTTIEDAYLDCNEQFRGFGGVCLPKDTAAFAALAKGLGLDVKLFEMIVEENKKFRMTVPEGMRQI